MTTATKTMKALVKRRFVKGEVHDVAGAALRDVINTRPPELYINIKKRASTHEIDAARLPVQERLNAKYGVSFGYTYWSLLGATWTKTGFITFDPMIAVGAMEPTDTEAAYIVLDSLLDEYRAAHFPLATTGSLLKSSGLCLIDFVNGARALVSTGIASSHVNRQGHNTILSLQESEYRKILFTR